MIHKKIKYYFNSITNQKLIYKLKTERLLKSYIKKEFFIFNKCRLKTLLTNVNSCR